MADEIIQKDITATVGDFSSGLTDYLVHLGLPSESILVEPDERTVVINNLPNIVTRLNDQQKVEAIYF